MANRRDGTNSIPSLFYSIFFFSMLILIAFIALMFLPEDMQLFSEIKKTFPDIVALARDVRGALERCMGWVRTCFSTGVVNFQRFPFALYLVIINLITFLAMCVDKTVSSHNEKHSATGRIAETTLLFLTAIGGALGGWIAMYTRHHKTRDVQFFIGVPSLLVVHIVVGVVLWCASRG